MSLLLALACSSATNPADTSGSDSAGSGDTADTAAGPAVTWFFGTSNGQTPDGSYVAPEEALLFIRTLDQAASTITEEVWSEARPAWTHYLLVHDVDAAGGTFTSVWVTDDGTIDVVGAYDAGDPWAWTAWHSNSTYRDGTYQGTTITSEDTLDGKGVATAHKSIWDETGTETWRIVEVLTPTTEDEFTAALADVQ